MENAYEVYTPKQEKQDPDDAMQEDRKPIVDGLNKNEPTESFTVPKNITTMESESKRNEYYTFENYKDKSSISIDHCYARPWNWKAESSFLRPTKTLFIPKNPSKISFTGQVPSTQENEDLIDVENVENQPAPIYDENKANQLMDECENHVKLFKKDEGNSLWEEAILNNNWTQGQIRLFNGVVSILNNHQLAKLASKGVHYEAICRRTAIDKSVQRLRRLMATVFWDQKLTQWLHQLLMDNLSTDYLSIYLDILQTLKGKLPSFVDKMLGAQSSHRASSISNENLQPLLKRQWDPVTPSLMQDKPKKLPGSPVLVVVPSSPVASNRYTKWINLLSNLATVINVPFNMGSPGQRFTTTHAADQMFASIRGQLQEIKNEHPNKNVVLVGFNAGAAMALQVAQVEPVLAVVCLGFSLLTAEGKRGEPEDTLLELQTPVLFVVGQSSTTSSQEDMEDLRERMRVETGLVVVGSADNFLRISKKKKRTEGITQSVVDRCIVEEIGEFVSGLVLSPFPPQIRQSPAHVPADAPSVSSKKAKIERKRYNSNASSLDSEDPATPIPPRISRPVGRPPGSKSKSKLEAKWAAQVAQGTETPQNAPAPNASSLSNVPASPSPSSTPPNTPYTIDTSSNDSFLDKQPAVASSSSSAPAERPPLSNFPPSRIKTLFPNPALEAPPKFARKVRTLKPTAQAVSSPSSSSATASTAAATNAATGGRVVIRGPPMSKGGQFTTPTSAKMQAYGMARHNIVGGSRLSNLLRGGIKTIPPSQPKTSSPIKNPPNYSVLENVTFAPGSNKIITNTIGKTVTVLNPGSGGGGSIKQTGTNVILMPDGKIKTISSGNLIRGRGTSYITSKKQLLGNKPPKPVKRFAQYKQQTAPVQLAPPTNLTTQDIMDLPIIFADDNQVIEEAAATPPPAPPPAAAPPAKIVASGNKYIFVNKPTTVGQSNAHFVISQTPSSSSKRPATTVFRQTPKYTKIILSTRNEEAAASRSSPTVISRIAANLSSEISVKKVSVGMGEGAVDLENELVATSIAKPGFTLEGGSGFRTISHIPSRQPGEKMKEGNFRRTYPSLVNDEEDDSDPDYVPPKMVKMNN